MVSLALALGLSSLSSNRMKVESLFIDEGFGSLDAETLRVAMDALESLRTQGRKIGVISHVQEMTERIPVQIRVNGRERTELSGSHIALPAVVMDLLDVVFVFGSLFLHGVSHRYDVQRYDMIW